MTTPLLDGVDGVDLFAGFGGFTEGAKQVGVRVKWAANHWPIAVNVHATNHPDVTHVCQDLRQANWAKLPRYDLLLASPACQGHSNASQPRRNEHHETMRSTAWAVVDCAEQTEPRAIIVENVPEFTRWSLFDIWLLALARLGYHTNVQMLIASRCGVPQRRQRVIITAAKRRKIHVVDPNTAEPAFGPCLEPDAGGWRNIAQAGADARERMRQASKLHRGAPCIVQHVTGNKGFSLHEPLRTITTKRQLCLVHGDRYRWLTSRELARGMGFPDSYTWPEHLSETDIAKGFGNAIPPKMAATAIEQVVAAL
jgi:DNA (cytosine-5)-methyltransferase 1